VNEAEFSALEARARAENLKLSEWVRVELLERREGGGGASDGVLLGEVLALRSIVINLLFSISKGEALTAEGMQALIERADKDKVRRALERLDESRLTVLSEARATKSEAGTTRETER